MKEKSERSHPPGVWSAKRSLREEYLLAVIRRILMGLEKRLCKPAHKGGSKRGVTGGKGQIFQKREIGSLQGREQAEPFIFLCMPKAEPAVELVPCDGKAFEDTFNGAETGKILSKDAENEKEAISGIRNDEVGKDGVGMPAGADKTQDADFMPDGRTIYEINKGTLVIGVDLAGTFCPTERACPQLWMESIHERLEQ